MKSRDRAGVHLPHVPITPIEEQKRLNKGGRQVEDRYKGSNHEIIANTNANDIRAQSHQKMKLMYKKQMNSHRATSHNTSLNTQSSNHQSVADRRNNQDSGNNSLATVVANSRENSNGPSNQPSF